GGGATELREAAKELFAPIRAALREASGRQRFEPPSRDGLDLEAEWARLAAVIDEVSKPSSSRTDTEAIETRAQAIKDGLNTVLRRDVSGYVYGMEGRGRGNVILSAAPIDVGPLLKESLFDRLHACVLTSATLSVGGSF